MLFNITLEKIIRNIHVSSSGTITNYFQRGITEQRPPGTLYSQPLQYLAYADDIALLGRNRNDIVKAFKELENASAEAGLVINEPKTKYMIMSRNTHADDNITINKHTFERVAAFKYLGATINEHNEIISEVKERLTAGNRSYFSLQKLLRSKNLSRGTKKIIYTTIIRPVVTYASETWTLTRKAENLLNIWERKILRKIYKYMAL